MSETPTPRTDAELYLPCGDDMVPSQRVGWVAASTARQLERELAEANEAREYALGQLTQCTEMLAAANERAERAEKALKAVQAECDTRARQLKEWTIWLDSNQPDVWRRGLWDANYRAIRAGAAEKAEGGAR